MDIHLNNDYDFYIKPGYTNMRKHARSLALMVESEMNLNPFSKAVFVFCGGRGKIIRAIVWDQNGWFEISKKLECQMSFRWPQNSWEASREVSYEQLLRLLKGEDSLRFFPVLEVSKVG